VRMCRTMPLSTESCVLVNFVFIQFRAGVRVCGGLTGVAGGVGLAHAENHFIDSGCGDGRVWDDQAGLDT
jgi:hypothetical protein